MDKQLLDIYSDYLICSFGMTTATGLSTLRDGAISHDKITRFLSGSDFTSADLWQLVKPTVRQVQSEDAVLVFDDSIEEKRDTDESELICWHGDHCFNRNVKGINFLTCLYRAPKAALPVAFELIKKTQWETNKQTGKPKRVCPKTKNEYFREMVAQCQHNPLPFRYVLADAWFSAAETMVYLKVDRKTDFIFPLKANRKVALSEEDKEAGRYVTVSTLPLEANAAQKIWLEGVPFPLLLCKQVFTNKDGSQGVLYLGTSDTELSGLEIQAIYQKRWKVEEYHKSVKSNARFAKSPTKTVRTQSNHIFACLWAYVKLESLRVKTTLNHFALKGRLYQAALTSAYQELQVLKGGSLPA